ncbi:MAG: riboflavin synthase [bacterium]
MFTGIVEALGTVTEVRKTSSNSRLTVNAGRYSKGIRPGDSVLVDGVCLTVAKKRGAHLSFDLAAETMRRTNLKRLKPGDRVNLEDSLRFGEPMGGHFVYGHVDGASKLLKSDGELLWVALSRRWAPYVVEKGAVALNGISLTVAAVKTDRFAVAIIPYTLQKTNLTDFRTGDALNFEIDPVSRYRPPAFLKSGKRE